MKRALIVIIAAAMASGFVMAEEGKENCGNKYGKGHHKGHGHHKHMIDKYDKDGDGKLSEEERGAAKAEWMKKVDTDGDGQVSEAEKTAAKEMWKEKHAERKAEFMKKFDKDGDGELSEAERGALKEAMKKHFGGKGKGKCGSHGKCGSKKPADTPAKVTL